MCKKLLALVLSLCSLLVLLSVSACEKRPPVSGDDSASSSIKGEQTIVLSSTQVALDRYESQTLTVTAKDEDGNRIDEPATWSSDNESVATVVDGVISAAGVGSATVTAQIGELSASATVTVTDSGALPVLGVSDENVELIVGDSYAVSATVLYKKQELQGAVISYEIADGAIASVDADGNITANKYGSTTMTVTGSWNGVTSPYLIQTVTINVKEDVVVAILDSELSIYTSNVELDGVSFSTTATLNGEVKVLGEVVLDTDRITWASSNEDIATIDPKTGVITANANGVEGYTDVTLTYASDNTSYTSTAIKVRVSYPLLDKTSSILVDVDATKGAIANQISASAIFGSDKAITKVLDGEADVLNDAEWVKNHDSGSEKDRIATVTVYNAEYAVKVKALVVTKVISTYEELAKMQVYGGGVDAASGSLTYHNYSGYFVLADNIVAPSDADVFPAKAIASLDRQDDVKDTFGFTGTFDGRGYTISGLKLGNGGLFGDIAKGSLIKNLAIINATIVAEAIENKGAGVLCMSACGADFENILIDYTTTKARNGIFGRYVRGGSLTNAVIRYKKSGGYNGGAINSWTGSKMTASNVYVVYAAGMAEKDSILNGEQGDNGYPFSTKITEIKEEEIASATFSGLGDAWTIIEGEMPMFSSSIKGLQISATEISVELGLPLEISGGVYDISGNIIASMPATWSSDNADVVSITADGVITVVGVGSANITVSYGGESLTCAVTVEPASLPIVDKTSVTLDLEANSTATLAEQLIAQGVKAGIYSSFEVASVATLDDKNVNLMNDASYLANADKANNRNVTLLVSDGAQMYKVNALIVTKIISTYEELIALQTYGNAQTAEHTWTHSNGTVYNMTYYNYGGYYVLANNIEVPSDAETLVVNSTAASFPTGLGSMWACNQANGFNGIFDGRGYTISGLKVGASGLFGDLANGSVIKNVAFADANICAQVGSNTGAGLLCYTAGKTTIENCYFDFTTSIARSGVLGRLSYESIYNNVVVNYKSTSGYDMGSLASMNNKSSATNVYIVVKTGSTVNFVFASTATYTGVTVINEADLATASFTGLDENYWKVAEGKVPTFKTAA